MFYLQSSIGRFVVFVYFRKRKDIPNHFRFGNEFSPFNESGPAHAPALTYKLILSSFNGR